MGFAPALRPEGVKGLSPGVLTPGGTFPMKRVALRGRQTTSR